MWEALPEVEGAIQSATSRSATRVNIPNFLWHYFWLPPFVSRFYGRTSTFAPYLLWAVSLGNIRATWESFGQNIKAEEAEIAPFLHSKVTSKEGVRAGFVFTMYLTSFLTLSFFTRISYPVLYVPL